ncbi:MAG: hypothetical protein ACXAD7_13160 [Candidatus Kariarchaeaceae archaeon]|jgi:Zn finger protein HypA/HybF involved in hydrogenase expression
MDQETELKNLIDHIPLQSNYSSNAQLQVSIPTNSEVSPSKALEILQNYAYNKGWRPDNITIIRTAGYIACEECKHFLHIHVATENAHYCTNCDHENKRRITAADVHIIDDPQN